MITKTRPSAVFAALAMAVCLVGLVPDVHGANSLTWSGSTAGDLMEKSNWGGSMPGSGDTLTVNGNYPGEFTFPAETPDGSGGYFKSLTIRSGGGAERSFNPGNGHVLHTKDLNIRYGEIFSFLSGVYDVSGTLSFGTSTASTDLTKATITGVNTVVKASTMSIGTGSATTGKQSKGEVTISDGAVVDATCEVGKTGGCMNSLLVTGQDTKLYATNGTSFAGSETAYGTTTCYSRNNSITVANGARFEAGTLRIGANDLLTWDNVLSVTNLGTASVSTINIYGTNKVIVADGGKLDLGKMQYFTEGSTIIVSNGVTRVKSLNVGLDNSANTFGNVFKVDDGAEVTVDTCYVYGTNSIVVSGGELVVTNALYVGRTENSAGGLGGSLLDVCGGRVTTKGFFAFNIGMEKRRVDAATVHVSNGGEIVMTNEANYVMIGPRGIGHALMVTGNGSKFKHYPRSTVRNVYVGTSSTDYANLLTRDNVLSVGDGGYFMTQASVVVGKYSTNETFAVSGGTADIGQYLQLGYDTDYNGAFTSNATFTVSGSQSRVRIGQSIQAGANSRIVFDLSDAQGSEEALVQLGAAPTFAPGSEIYVTSSDPQINKKGQFDCTLISSAENMDLSNVSITFDPEVDIRRLASDNPKVLKVRCGRRSGMILTFK